MPRPASSQPTEGELEILRVLWESGPSTAREIHNRLSETKDTNYSTTVKMLTLMLKKGLVDRNRTARPQVFRAAETQRKTQRQMLSHLIDKVYDGSAASLVLQALSSQEASPEDLAEIRELIEELEGGGS